MILEDSSDSLCARLVFALLASSYSCCHRAKRVIGPSFIFTTRYVTARPLATIKVALVERIHQTIDELFCFLWAPRIERLCEEASLPP